MQNLLASHLILRSTLLLRRHVIYDGHICCELWTLGVEVSVGVRDALTRERRLKSRDKPNTCHLPLATRVMA